MRRFLILLVTALLPIISYAQNGVKWESCSFVEAVSKARSEGCRQIFLDCYTKWCGPCRHMLENVFTKEEAGEYFNRHFLNIKIDMESAEGVGLAKRFNIKAYPTFIILNCNGEEVGRIVGGGKLDEFIKRVEMARKIENSPQYLLDKYNSSKEVDDAYAYLEKLKSLSMDEEMTAFMKENYYVMPQSERYKPKMWGYMKRALTIADMELLDRVIDEKYEYDYRCGKGAVDRDIFGELKSDLIAYLSGRKEFSSDNVQKACNIMVLCGELDYYEKFIIMASKALADGDYEKFAELYDANYMCYTYSQMEMSFIKSYLLNNKNVPESKKREFLEEYRRVMEQYMKMYNDE